MDAKEQKRKTIKSGTVVGKTMMKTVKVQVERQIRHPLYKKTIKKKKAFLVHDENGRCRVGDIVRIIETRPISKRKKWRVLEVVASSSRALETDHGDIQ